MTDQKPIDWDELWRTARADAQAAARDLPTLQGKARALYTERLIAMEQAQAIQARYDTAGHAAERAQIVAKACGLIQRAAQTEKGRLALNYAATTGRHDAGQTAERNYRWRAAHDWGLIDARGFTPLGLYVRDEMIRLINKETDQ